MPRTGMSSVKESIDRAKNRVSISNNGRLNYFTWKDGDKFVVRFLTDDVLTANFYEWIATNDGKTKDFIVAPDYHSDDPSWKGEDWVLKYGGKAKEFKSKQLVDPKAREVTVGVAVLREEKVKDGKPVVQDHFEKIDVGGTSYDSRWFGIIKQSHGNFWSHIMAYYNRYGTICDRDYEITREGDGKDTKYHFVPVYEDPTLPDAAAVQKQYGYGKKFADDDPTRFLYVPQTLAEWGDQYASEDRAKFWLTDREGAVSTSTPVAAPNGLGEFRPETTANPVVAEVQNSDDFDALRAKLLANQ
jgi:hypothetical protein